MPKRAKELSALEVGRLKDQGLHSVGGVSGLYLQVRGVNRSWILRSMVGGKRRDMGLGPFPEVPLAGAREKARQAKALTEAGADPILERQRAQSALRASQAGALTFAQAATKYIDAKSAEWKNGKHRDQWINTIEAYANPVIGKLLVSDVRQEHVLSVLEPIWTTKTETASRLRGRIEQVLDWARVRGYRTGENPARWRGHLDKLLPQPKKIAKVEHFPALPVDQMPGFMAALREREGTGARALAFLALVAARSSEVRNATWSEINLDEALWVIPASRMKASREHRVPLSAPVVRLLRELPRQEGTDLVFPGAKGKALSDMTLTAIMRRMGLKEVPHGLRSTFRDWASERTNYPREVAEMALAHAIENKVEAAYRRGDLFDKRQRMMSDWAGFCLGVSK